MTITEMREVVERCAYPGYNFTVNRDGRGTIYLQAEYVEPDTVTRVPSKQLTRRWLLSPASTVSEIAQTVFKCVLTSMEHKTREWFTYRGKPVFGPHFDVEALYEACTAGKFDEREIQV